MVSKRNMTLLLPTAREGSVFIGVCLSTIGLMATSSLLGLHTAWSVRILLECFLVACNTLVSFAWDQILKIRSNFLY